MPQYQNAKPFDFVRDFKDLQNSVKRMQIVSPGVHTVPANQTDVPLTPLVVTGTAFADLTQEWAIPAYDANPNTIYWLTAWGDIATGGTTQVLTYQVSVFGQAMAPLKIGAAWFQASTTYEWEMRAKIMVRDSTTIKCWMTGTISMFGVNLNPASVTQGSGGFVGATGATTFDPTTDSIISLQAEWASTGQSMSCAASELDRRGP